MHASAAHARLALLAESCGMLSVMCPTMMKATFVAGGQEERGRLADSTYITVWQSHSALSWDLSAAASCAASARPGWRLAAGSAKVKGPQRRFSDKFNRKQPANEPTLVHQALQSVLQFLQSHAAPGDMAAVFFESVMLCVLPPSALQYLQAGKVTSGLHPRSTSFDVLCCL